MNTAELERRYLVYLRRHHPTDYDRLSRVKRAECEDDSSSSTGNYGFNSYSLLTFMLLGFNAVSNVIANVNNNDNNNNNNINANDFGSVQGTSQDTDITATSMTMVVVIVPPVGPPIPVIVGRALPETGHLALEPQFKNTRANETFFEMDTQEGRVFLNGTMQYSNGTVREADIIYGLVHPRDPRAILDFRKAFRLDTERPVSWAGLQQLSRGRRSAQEGQPVNMLDETLDNYIAILAVAAENPQKLQRCQEDLICAVKRVTPFLWGREACRLESSAAETCAIPGLEI